MTLVEIMLGSADQVELQTRSRAEGASFRRRRALSLNPVPPGNPGDLGMRPAVAAAARRRGDTGLAEDRRGAAPGEPLCADLADDLDALAVVAALRLAAA